MAYYARKLYRLPKETNESSNPNTSFQKRVEEERVLNLKRKYRFEIPSLYRLQKETFQLKNHVCNSPGNFRITVVGKENDASIEGI